MSIHMFEWILVYWAYMHIRWITGVAFCLHVILGNFCMMSMAHAEDMPMPSESHAAMASMSQADCEHCLHEQQKSDSESQKSPCANGHCISQAVPTNAVSNIGTNTISITAIPALVFINSIRQGEVIRPTAHAPPNPPIITKTIVLLM